MSPPAARRVEEASLNAWPALHQLLLDGWVLRFARGFTKRANSVVPLYESALPIAEKVHFCENLYARERLTPIFRLTSLTVHDALEAHLEARGYRRADETRVMCRPLEPPSARGAHAITLLPQTEWLDAYGEITATPDTARSLHGLLLNAIRTPHALAVLRRTTRGHEASPDALACGLGVLESELLGLFDLATHTQHRRRGYGRALLEGLLHWGARAGARHAYLQVLEANSIARRLYEQMNFATLYRYWYRIAPD